MAKLILVTCGKREDAERISRSILEEKLAACVNIVPGVLSYYWWEDKINRDTEELMLIKTADHLVPQLEQAIIKLHPYTTPEFIVLSPEMIEERYEKWLLGAVKKV